MKTEWWRRFIDLRSIESIERNRKALVLYSISYLGSLIMFWFAYVTGSNNEVLFAVISFSGVIIFINALLSHFVISLKIASYVASFSIFTLLIGLAYTGGYDSTGLYWMFPFPLVLFILLNYKAGLIFNLLLFGVIFFIINSPELNVANYDPETNIRFAVAISLTIFFAFLSELVRSQNHRDLVSLSLEKHQLAHTDQLTNLPNRRFLEHLERLSENDPNNSVGFPLAVIMADIDFFKAVNDKHGHDVGDQVLKHLAAFFKQHIRGSDIVIRMGGEEFLLLFPHTDAVAAKSICNKLNCLLEKDPYQHDGGDITVTLSFGIAFAAQSNQIEPAIVEADKLLYLAKENGRGRAEVLICEEDIV